MKYTRLNKLRNTYPSESGNPTKSYTYDNNSIRYTGLFPTNFIKFSILSLEDIKLGTLKTDPNINFRFLVKFVDGDSSELWTSDVFLRTLHGAIQDNNPYFNKNTVTTAIIDFQLLKQYWKEKKFDVPEQYAEVRVLNTINTKEEILKHINWIVSESKKDEELRDVKTFGGWTVELSEQIGFDHSEELKKLDLKLE